ncbi:MAG TPA: alcohol dehydrogenase catalytic domain-containing protein [Streptosporangiaceae bacterium]|jgi:threonine dehydrogenase-like Zn-dependent dehydrogenase
MSSHTIQALRIHARGDLRLEDIPARRPEPGQAVVRIEYGGICGSDIHYWRDGAVGASVLKAPMTLGHEIVGTVLRAAAGGPGPAAGTPVAVYPALVCGRCRWCRDGQSHLCAECRYLGSAAQWPHTDGGFATELTVAATRLIPLPPGLPLKRAALAEPAGVAWHAVSRAGAVGAQLAGARVTVVGGGPIGLLVAAVARYRGAGPVGVTDVRARPLQVATEMGLDQAGLGSEAGGPGPAPEADIVFECSGAPAGLATALRSVRRGGTVVAVGQLPRADAAEPAWRIVTGELTVTGSLRLDGELPDALSFLADPAARVDPVISHVYPLARAAEAFEIAADSDVSSKVLLRCT